MESLFNLNGKIAFVTGAARGIGWQTALMLASNGAKVIINDLADSENLQTKIKDAKEQNIDLTTLFFDVSDYVQVKNAYSSIFKEFKRLDILVNNAGIMEDSMISTASEAHIEKTFKINTFGAIYNTQYASRLMARNNSGSIINISSIIGTKGNAGESVYSASKSALIGLTLSTAKELAPLGIRVNAIAPGFIDTDLVSHFSEEIRQKTISNIKLGRIGTPEDVAKAVLFFASDLSAYITGQVLGVDGGMII
ncbi:MAG: glucose 1-dehydrogenase [Candidatus Kapabacteria bacterium]|nr:glucose 1-dehydrogenase [Candidatus Kapabacteria bacterium]